MGRRRDSFCVISRGDFRVEVIQGYKETVNAGAGFVDVGYAYFKGRGWKAYELTSGIDVCGRYFESMEKAQEFVREHAVFIRSQVNVYMRDEDSIIYRSAQAVKDYQRRATQLKTKEEINGSQPPEELNG